MTSVEPVIVSAIDLVTMLACLAAAGFVLRGWKRSGLAPEIPAVFLLLAGLMALYGFGLFLEWSSLLDRIDWNFIEDFSGVFVPFTWVFAFYVVDKSVIVRDLEISRTQFRNLVESTSDWIWEVDTEGRYTFVSSRVWRILGYTPEELLGKTPFDFMPPAEAARFSKLFAGFLQNRASFQHAENLNLHKDGHEVYLETNATPIFDVHGKLTGYRGVDRDITERKQAEQALREVEQRKELALQGGDLGAWDWDFPTGKVIYDQRWASMLGYAPGELEPDYSTWERLVHPDDLGQAKESLKPHLDGKTDFYQAETRMKHKDGHWVWVLTKGKVIERDDDGRPLRTCGTHMDITHRKQAEQALRESEQRYRNFIQLSSHGIARFEFKEPVPVRLPVEQQVQWIAEKGILAECNDLFAQMYDRKNAQDFVGQQIYDLWDNQDVADRVLRQLIESQYQWDHVETREITKEGIEKYFLNNMISIIQDGCLTSQWLTQVDITEMVHTREALRLTQFAIDHAGESAYWMKPDGRFIYVNEKACRSLGYSPEELLTMSAQDIDPDFSAEVWPDHWEEVKRKEWSRVESHHKRKDGVVFPVEITANFVTYHDHEYICAFARDISERRAAEQEREVLMEQLRQRNDELQSIVFTAAHDLRSPLVNIAGFTGELEKGLAKLRQLLDAAALDQQAVEQVEHLLTNDIAESLGFIRFGSKHMDTLLNGLMHLSVVGSAPIQLSEVNMKEVFGKIIEGQQYRINEHVVDVSVPEDLPDCFGDFAMLTQVFGNLIENAIKYRHPERPAIIEIGASVQDDIVEYTVADNGIGIETAHLEKVFELFHRLSPAREQDGQGLGLTIVRRILDRLGGTARIDSVPDLGTTVYVRLPRA